MSKVEQLIDELCPSGVKSIALKEICEIYDGTHTTPKYTNEGVRFVSVENIRDLYSSKKCISFDDYNKLYKIKPQKGDVMMTRIGTIGDCTVIELDEELAFYVTLALIRPKQQVLNSRYVKYIIESTHGKKELRKRTLIHAVPIKINLGDIGKIIIPIPPLAIQQEIVRILDIFTELTAELTVELTAELTARRKQYKYYYDMLLTFSKTDSSIQYLTIGDVFDLRNGYTPSKSNNEYWENGEIPWFRMEDIRQNGNILCESIQHVSSLAVKGGLFPANSIILATSATIGIHALVTVDFLANQRFTCITRKSKYESSILSKFVYYYCYLLDEWCLNNTNVSSFASIDIKKIKNFSFPILPLKDQERIVSILDRFDTLVNDITIGLPAEIEARRKQYEYYRDKLLTFKELQP
jgi:type I restriction enzyme S subunit